jgi:hypothetical protein
MRSQPNLRAYAALSLVVDLVGVFLFLRVVRLWWQVYARSSSIIQVTLWISVADTLLLLCFTTTNINGLARAPSPSGRRLPLSVESRDR